MWGTGSLQENRDHANNDNAQLEVGLVFVCSRTYTLYSLCVAVCCSITFECCLTLSLAQAQTEASARRYGGVVDAGGTLSYMVRPRRI